MKRHRFSRIESDFDGGMDISSLVDICFLLLIYFIVTSVITPAERDLPIGPPGQELTETSIPIEPLLISIDDSGQVFSGEGFEQIALDADPGVRTLPLLESRLSLYQQGVKAVGGEFLVIIDANEKVTTQRVVDVLNTLAGMGVRNVTFRDQRSGQ